jgi:hypothetical protein
MASLLQLKSGIDGSFALLSSFAYATADFARKRDGDMEQVATYLVIGSSIEDITQDLQERHTLGRIDLRSEITPWSEDLKRTYISARRSGNLLPQMDIYLQMMRTVESRTVLSEYAFSEPLLRLSRTNKKYDLK